MKVKFEDDRQYGMYHGFGASIPYIEENVKLSIDINTEDDQWQQDYEQALKELE